jgi:predicted phosphoribosyltransferase
MLETTTRRFFDRRAAPGKPELGIGAVAEGDVLVLRCEEERHRTNVFDVGLLSERLVAATRWGRRSGLASVSRRQAV